tara:strand:+ start:2026 stop:2469 length:444 start_codon:yes stop_codon:yes gene_type:complete
MNGLRSTFLLALSLLSISGLASAEIPAAAAFLVGEWESTEPTNRYRMRVSWDDSKDEFYGLMSKNGRASGRVGFKIDEHVFTAKFLHSPRMLVVVQKYRSGSAGVSSWGGWLPASIDLEASSRDRLVANFPEALGETTRSYYIRVEP